MKQSSAGTQRGCHGPYSRCVSDSAAAQFGSAGGNVLPLLSLSVSDSVSFPERHQTQVITHIRIGVIRLS